MSDVGPPVLTTVPGRVWRIGCLISDSISSVIPLWQDVTLAVAGVVSLMVWGSDANLGDGLGIVLAAWVIVPFALCAGSPQRLQTRLERNPANERAVRLTRVGWGAVWAVAFVLDPQRIGGLAVPIAITALGMRFVPRPAPGEASPVSAGWFRRTVTPRPSASWVLAWVGAAIVALVGCAWGWVTLMLALQPSVENDGFPADQPAAWAIGLVVLVLSLVLAEWVLRRRPWAVPRAPRGAPAR